MDTRENAVAIVGLGCILPDAPDPAVFWRNTLAGRTALRSLEGPPWNLGRHLDPDPQAPDRTTCAIGAPIDGFRFDWRKYRISPAGAAAMNPIQLYTLDAGTRALEEVRRLPRATTGIFLGASGLGWRGDAGLRIRMDDLVDSVRRSDAFGRLAPEQREAALESARRALSDRLGTVSEDHAVNAAASIAAGRIAMQLDLRGLHHAVDASFASALAALDAGVRSLRDGTVDLALVGGASELLTPLDVVAFAKLGWLARDRVAPFDADAEGTLLGEGVALFALKRLEDALRDGETIYAVVRGVGAATDASGPSFVGGRVDSQVLAMRRAYEDAGVSPDTVGFVECDAAGIPADDAIEVRALAKLFSGGSRERVALGSAKSLVGHLRAGAGAVGLLRAVLSLHHGTVPAQPGFSKASPALETESARFCVPTAPRPLDATGGAERSRAGVSAFGLGGCAYHAVLEAHRPGSVPRRPRRRAAPEPIAIVGMGAIFPGADGVPAFWRSLLDGRDATCEVPRERWDIDRYHDPDPRRHDKSYTRIGCFLEALPAADDRWGIPEAERPNVDPEQLLVLRAAEEAVADAGLDPGRWDRHRTGVALGFLALQGKRYLADVRVNHREFALELERVLLSAGLDEASVRRVLAEAEREFKRDLPPITCHTIPGFAGSVSAARIARRFDLRGPHLTVESACSSTLSAVHVAVQALRHGVCDTLIAGGVWADIQPEFLVGVSRFYGVTATAITPFDARASGFVTGEGAGVLVLRRAADAERDGQRIHALIRAVAGSSDGRGRSVFAPTPEGEALAMGRAIEECGVDAALVEYLECHGTGTAVGDVTEIEACTRAYGKARPRPLLVGSVKSNIGHLMAAAGAPSLIKAALAVREGLIPPSLKFETPNPKIDFATGPVKVLTGPTPWSAPDGEPRRAGVNGFGLGGTNMHVILEQYRARSAASPRAASARVAPGAGGPRVLPIAAAGAQDLAACVERLSDIASRVHAETPAAYSRALADSQAAAERAAAARVAIVAATPEVLARRLDLLRSALARGADLGFLRQQGVFVGSAKRPPPIAAVFPGQGPQYPNMLRDALAAFPEIGETLDAADRSYEELCGRALRPSFFCEDAAVYSQKDEDIHCAVFAVNVALFRLLERYALRVDAVMGQSAGELAALVAAGVLSLEDGLRAVRARTLAVLGLETSDPGRMIALTCPAENAEALVAGLPGYAAVAADNSSSACIVSADAPATKVLLARAAERGIEAEVLAVSHGYHSQLIAGARPPYRAALDALTFRPAALRIISTITGDDVSGIPATRFPEHLETQFVEPVRLRKAVETLYAGGTRLFVECGPKWPLTTFIGEILSGRPHVAQATIHPKVGEAEQLHRALACLFVHGAARLFAGRSSAVMHIEATEARPEPALPGGSRAEPVAPPVVSPAHAQDPDLVALLRGVRDLLDAYLSKLDVARQRPSADASPQAVAEAAASPAPLAGRPDAPDSLDDARESARRLIVAEMVKRTGYPEDMLDLDLDLEAELGIDTVKQVAVLAAVRERLGLPPDPKFRLRDANTLRKAVDYVARRLAGGGAPGGHAAAQPPDLPPAAKSPAAAVAREPAAAATGSMRASAADEVRKLLVAEMVKRTGYPEEMLELDLDLEADLGIDTVKQVAVLATAREHFGLAPDPGFRLRDANTLRKAIEYVARRVEQAAQPVPAFVTRTSGNGCPAPSDSTSRAAEGIALAEPSRADGARPRALPRAAPHADGALAVRRREMPGPEVVGASALEESRTSREQSGSNGNGLLGAVSYYVRQAVTDYPPERERSVLGDSPLPARATPVVDWRLVEGLLAAASAAAPDACRGFSCLAVHRSMNGTQPAAAVRRDPSGALHVSATARAASAEALFADGRGASGSWTVSSEMRAALLQEARVENGPALRALLAATDGSSGTVVRWCRAASSTVVVGACRVGEAQAEERSRLAAVVESASEIASMAWFALTGARHRLARVETARFVRAPGAGEEIRLHAAVAPRQSGFAHADVVVLGAGGEPIASLQGLAGEALEAPAGVGSGSSQHARSWQRFYRLLSGAVDEEVAP